MRESNFRERNEHIANLYIAKMMRVCAGFTVLAFVLNSMGVFIVDKNIMLASCLIGIIVLFIPTIIINVQKRNDPWVKYIAVICSSIFVIIISITLNFHTSLMYLFPMALASIYFTPRLNIIAMIIGIAGASAGQFLAYVLETTVDLNYPTMYKVCVHSIIPKALMLFSMGYIFIEVGKSTNQMMSSLMDAEEQEKVFLHMKRLTDKSSEVSKGLSESIKTLTSATQNSKKANYEISENTGIIVEGIQNSIEQLSVAENNSAQIYESVQELAEESEEIAKLFVNVENLSDENKSFMQSATHGMEVMQESTDICQKAMLQLEEKTKKIDGIVEVIADISDQTDLLSLNAAIESARAGEQGRGFAVVSEEIRKLSQQTQKTLSDIKQIIGEVLEQNAIAVNAMNQTAAVHEEQKDVILKAEQSAQDVMTATKEMTAKMNLISNNTKYIETSTGQIVEIVNMITRICQENQESLKVVSGSVETGVMSMEELEILVQSIYEMANELSAVIQS